jgi:hypothetical protein
MEVLGSVAAAAQLAGLGCRSLIFHIPFYQGPPGCALLILQDLGRFC